MKEKIAVLGAGSWGATLATLLANNGHDVSLWEFNPAIAKAMSETRELSILPGLKLPASIAVTSDIRTALQGHPVILSVTPSHFVRSTLQAAVKSGAIDPQARIISASKGLEEKTLKRMSEVICEELGWKADRVAVLGGPSHAEEVFKKMPTATVAASQDKALAARVQDIFNNEFFRVYAHNDPVGVELGAVFKNVLAVGCGISDGLGLGDNTKAAIMTRGLNEMARLGCKLGAQRDTFFGLAGIGDLIVTCTSRHSRNRSFGEKIGKGLSPEQALKEMVMVAEGYITASAVFQLSEKMKTDTPLMNEIYNVLYQGKNPQKSLQDLMSRAISMEMEGIQ